ncbi:hypothetical protein FRC05_002022 [Tulasnella sp. 425]|nr:hypothetical protein FRC05_002022 [Tulasnella sp. 425]
MSSPGQPEKVNEFRGKDGAECESFIKSIRETAWKEGKLQDALWMANFASLHFSGKALKWHSTLSLDVRQDWFKQEMALLERWPPPADESDDEEAEAAIVPTPAAASLLPTQAGKSSDIGIMQFVPISRDENSVYIAAPDSNGACELTTEVGQALRLRWDRSVDSRSRILEWVGSGNKWLAIHWSPKKPNFAKGSTMWARLTIVDPDTFTPATLGTAFMPPTLGPFRVKVWRVSSEGQLTPVWTDGVKEIQLEVFRSEPYVYFTVDPDEYQKENPMERRGRLVFQPIE